MCGTDLESQSGMATADIKEMLNAGIGDNVNLLIYTGGCAKWRNTMFSKDVNQIYQIEGNAIQCLESKIDMVDSSLDEEKTAHDEALTELRNRLAALEKKAAKEPGKKDKKGERNRIRDLTWLIGVAGTVVIIILLIRHFLP